jgi:hypothetical protein
MSEPTIETNLVPDNHSTMSDDCPSPVSDYESDTDAEESYYAKSKNGTKKRVFYIRLGSSKGFREITWSAFLPENLDQFENVYEGLSHRNLSPGLTPEFATLAAQDLATALEQMQALSINHRYGTGINSMRNSFYLPQEPKDTMVTIENADQTGIPLMVTSSDRIWCIELEFFKHSQVLNMFQQNWEKGNTSFGLLSYNNEDLINVTRFVHNAFYFPSSVPCCQKWRFNTPKKDISLLPYRKIDNSGIAGWSSGKYMLRIVFPATRAARKSLDKIYLRLRTAKGLAFMPEDLANAMFVEQSWGGQVYHLEKEKRRNWSRKIEKEEHCPSGSCDEHKEATWIDVLINRTHSQHSKDLLSQHAWFKQDQAFYKFYKRDTKRVEPVDDDSDNEDHHSDDEEHQHSVGSNSDVDTPAESREEDPISRQSVAEAGMPQGLSEAASPQDASEVATPHDTSEAEIHQDAAQISTRSEEFISRTEVMRMVETVRQQCHDSLDKSYSQTTAKQADLIKQLLEENAELKKQNAEKDKALQGYAEVKKKFEENDQAVELLCRNISDLQPIL